MVAVGLAKTLCPTIELKPVDGAHAYDTVPVGVLEVVAASNTEEPLQIV